MALVLETISETVKEKQWNFDFKKIKAWGGRNYSWIQSELQQRNKAFIALIAADILFLKIAFKIAHGINNYYFSRPEELSLNKKLLKDFCVLSGYVFTYATMHYSFFKGMKLALNPRVAAITGIFSFLLGNFLYLKYLDKNL